MFGIDKPVQENSTPKDEIWPENQETWLLFTGVTTQVRLDANGRIVGIDYCALKLVSELYGITLNKERFLDIQAMEKELVDAS